ncbi:unnamed protein product [Heligmosomoides polygyrus]|uniref:DUF1838 domain-containing protein n=1 Tax=Heligmosomoides polygyrus TaxID=6339 RepID=A0A183FE70_HELPZ|nr:unnamed protein product [Heligmosomoides polygyrus]
MTNYGNDRRMWWVRWSKPGDGRTHCLMYLPIHGRADPLDEADSWTSFMRQPPDEFSQRRHLMPFRIGPSAGAFGDVLGRSPPVPPADSCAWERASRRRFAPPSLMRNSAAEDLDQPPVDDVPDKAPDASKPYMKSAPKPATWIK